MPRDLALFTNSKHIVGASASKIEHGTLGDWLAGRQDGRRFTTFDPDRIALVVGTAHGQMRAVFEVVEDEAENTWGFVPDAKREGRVRIRFNGKPSEKYAQLIGQASPVTWKRGERTPVKTLPIEVLDTFLSDYAVSGAVSAGRVRVGQAVVSVTPEGFVLVETPPGVAVLVRTLERPSN